MSELYNTRILRLATQIPFTERLDDPNVTVSRTSRICGSRLVMDADFEDGRIARLGLKVRACALGQASAALVAPKLVGLNRNEVERAAHAFAKMLDSGGDVPPPPFSELEIFLPVREHRSRRGSVMLIFDAALAAFDAAEGHGAHEVAGAPAAAMSPSR